MKHNFGFALLALAAAAAIACATACSSSSNASSSASDTTSAATQAPAASPAAAGGADGAQAFAANCSSCHQANGQGVVGAFPPLAGNATVTGDPKAVIHIVKYGLTGKVVVGGKTFDGTMPPWTTLPDATIASVVTYIRSSWGNSASAVTTADVAAVKK
jgi:cytochrome c oxidase cbb3-type subunit 2